MSQQKLDPERQAAAMEFIVDRQNGIPRLSLVDEQRRQIDALTARIRAQESQLKVAMELVRDYYWVQSRKEGARVDEKARLMMSLYFPEATSNGNAPYSTPATTGGKQL